MIGRLIRVFGVGCEIEWLTVTTEGIAGLGASNWRARKNNSTTVIQMPARRNKTGPGGIGPEKGTSSGDDDRLGSSKLMILIHEAAFPRMQPMLMKKEIGPHQPLIMVEF